VSDDFHDPELISTGHLPREELVVRLMQDAHDRYAGVDEGAVADYIPALADADPALFGLSIVSVAGASHSVGDAQHAFSIQSISKAFVFALVCDALGPEVVLDAVGVNNTGLPFNSVMALELNAGSPMNPLVNAGALATTSLVPGGSADEKWTFLRAGLSAFAGRPLELDADVYASEAAHNRRNQAIARLLESYGRIAHDPLETTDVYTRQCSLLVSAKDLAVMGATLADGGLYERSGEWLFSIGLPGKSGVSGGIVTVAPGKGSLSTFSPRLDAAGNSVRGQLATRYLSGALGLNLFASRPEVAERP
jgi:glutaminase